jgi:hypothetical protein
MTRIAQDARLREEVAIVNFAEYKRRAFDADKER